MEEDTRKTTVTSESRDLVKTICSALLNSALSLTVLNLSDVLHSVTRNDLTSQHTTIEHQLEQATNRNELLDLMRLPRQTP